MAEILPKYNSIFVLKKLTVKSIRVNGKKKYFKHKEALREFIRCSLSYKLDQQFEMTQWLRILGKQDLNMEFVRALLAEFIGTFFFVLIGTLAQSFKPHETEWPRASPIQIAFASGATAFSLSHSLGPISGALLNPAVSVSFFLICGMSLISCVGYIIVQCAGGLAAAGIVSLALDKALYQDEQMLRPLIGVTALEICLVEGVASFLWVIMSMVTAERRNEDVLGNRSFCMFFTIMASYLIATTITGGGVNPVRSLVAALLMKKWTNHMCYWLGPMTGAFIAAMLYLRLYGTAKNRHVYRMY